MKKLMLVAIGLAALVAVAAGTKCRYCNITGYGKGCTSSPNGIHRHIETDAKCEYCGNSGYGFCVYNPEKVHVHGSGNGKCVYCGRTGTGRGCPYAPSGIHQK